MFEEGEATKCPVCGVALAKLEKLPLSHDALVDEAIEPEHERLPFLYLRRGRGAMLAVTVIGLALFFAPWIHAEKAGESAFMSGLDIARRFGWPWGVVVAWFVLLPTVLSRRTIAQLRSARVAAAMMSAFPAVTATIFATRPLHATGLVPTTITFVWPIWATIAASALAVLLSLRLGGRIDDMKASRGSSVGHTVH
jgi:hypothetical protein